MQFFYTLASSPVLFLVLAKAEDTVPGPVAAAVVRVIDGDTFEARAEVWPDIHVTVAVRVAGIDAPELHARCARERELAVSARALLAGALPPGAAVLLTR
ncbi:MAG: hypothetical protein K0S81_2564, partial [Rhodospirillales bacterium]|nr:hypothetical protein [Rhodospirillales bacterium]